jgi:hypothetical protein
MSSLIDVIRSALVIASDEYQDPGLARLRAPVTDASALGGVLGDPRIGGFEVAMSSNETEARLRREIGRFFADRGRDDLLLLYIACHGVKDEDGRLYFATSDTELQNLAATAISADFVDQQISRSRSRSVVLILDCCYSGAFSRGMTTRASGGIDLLERFDGRGRVVITSSTAMEYAFEDGELAGGEGEASVFTSAVVQGLQTGEADLDGDGWITVRELYEYVYDAVRRRTGNQSPTMSSSDTVGDIFLARNPLSPPTGPAPEGDARPAVDPGSSPESVAPGEPDDRPEEDVPYTTESIVANDYWTVGDELDYEAYADAIADFIQHHDTKPPLTIGIKAPWGAGKTSLMRMIQDRLDPPRPGKDGLTGDERQRVVLTAESRQIVAWRPRWRTFWRRRSGLHTAPVDVSNGMVMDKLRQRTETSAKATSTSSERTAPDNLRAEPTTSATWRPTVWFNPWMYQSGEQVWAGLASEAISQITGRMSAVEREAFWLELNLRRVDADAIRRRIHLALLMRLIPLAVALGITVLVAAVLLVSRSIFPGIDTALDSAARAVVATGTLGVVLAGFVRAAAFWREHVAGSVSTIVNRPDYAQGWQNFVGEQSKAALSDAIREPGYESRLGFLYLVQTDMRRVLDLVATKDRPIVVFVDDLDRCSPSTVAQVIEAINLFLAGQFPNCVFVVAMEPEMVAGHIEVAYKDLVDTLAGGDYWGEARTLGWRFLDKIVQLPISLPVLRSEQASAFLGTALVGWPGPARSGSREGNVDAGRVRQLQEDIRRRSPALDEIAEAATNAQESLTGISVSTDGLSSETQAAMRRELQRRLRPDNPEVQAIVTAVAGRLARNPREIKRFVNVFRFYTVIRQEREAAGLPAPDTLAQIAKLAVIAVRWPHLRSALGRQIGPTDRDTVLALLEEPIAELGEAASWSARKAALHSVLSEAEIPDQLKADLLVSEDLCTLLASQPPIGTTTAGYL